MCFISAEGRAIPRPPFYTLGFFTLPSSFFILHSSFFILHSSLFTLRSSLYIQFTFWYLLFCAATISPCLPQFFSICFTELRDVAAPFTAIEFCKACSKLNVPSSRAKMLSFLPRFFRSATTSPTYSLEEKAASMRLRKKWRDRKSVGRERVC